MKNKISFISQFQRLAFNNDTSSIYKLIVEVASLHAHLLDNDTILTCYHYLFDQDEHLVPLYDSILRSLDLVSYDIDTAISGRINICHNIDVLKYFLRIYDGEVKEIESIIDTIYLPKMRLIDMIRGYIQKRVLFE